MKDIKDTKLIKISDEAYNKALEVYPVDMQKYNGIEGEYDANMYPRMLWAVGYDAALKEHKIKSKLRAKTIAPDESESRTRLQETERIDAQK